MAAQPCLSAADAESLLEPLKTAAALLNNMVVQGESTLKHTNRLINEVQNRLQQHDSAREQHSQDDNYMSNLLHLLAKYGPGSRFASHGLADQDEGLHPPLGHQRNNLNSLDLAGLPHPYHSPLLNGAANEQPTCGGRGVRPNRDTTPYDAADDQMASGQHKDRPNRSATPCITHEDVFMTDDERRGHAHGQRFRLDRLPSLSDFNPGSFLDTYHDPRGGQSRREPYRGHGTGHYGVQSLGSQPPRGHENRLDNIYDHDSTMAPRPHSPNLERANVRVPWHHSTDYPFPDGFGDHRIGKDLCEAQARQTLDSRSTRHHAPLDFTSDLRVPTAVEIGNGSSPVRTHNRTDADKLKLARMQAQLRQLNKQDAGFNGINGITIPKAGHIARPLRTIPDLLNNDPVPFFFNNDLEQPPRHCYDIPVRPDKKDTIQVCTARKDGFDYSTLPVHLVQRVNDLKRQRVAFAMSTALPKDANEGTFHGQQHALRPVDDAKRGNNTAYNSSGVGAITDPSKNDENPIIPPHPSSDSSESSDSGYDTPDFDETSGAGGEDKNDAEGLGWLGM